MTKPPKRPKLVKYHCKHCGKTMERESNKAWIKSFCELNGKNVRLVRLAAKERGPR